MSFATGYRGEVGGSVQKGGYTDQPGEGVPGMLAFASDINLVDAVYIGEDNGIAAGRGVIFEDVDDLVSLQRPNVKAMLPIGTTTADEFQGIVVFDERMNSNADGVPGWAKGRVGRILLNKRSGGRIYVNCPETVAIDDLVYLQRVADANYEVGEFRPSIPTIPADAIEIPNAKWVTSLIVPPLVLGRDLPNNVVMLELFG